MFGWLNCFSWCKKETKEDEIQQGGELVQVDCQRAAQPESFVTAQDSSHDESLLEPTVPLVEPNLVDQHSEVDVAPQITECVPESKVLEVIPTVNFAVIPEAIPALIVPHYRPCHTEESFAKSDSYMSRMIYKAVYNQWSSVSRDLNSQDFKVIAAFVAIPSGDPDSIRVLSIGTGSKCTHNHERMQPNGEVVLDSHAEIVARRALLCLLYEQIEMILSRTWNLKTINVSQHLIIERKSNGAIGLKSHLKIYLYISLPPCGASIRGGKLSPKNGKTFMFCSDKIAKWNVLGLQGALLSGYIEPIYLSGLVCHRKFPRMSFNNGNSVDIDTLKNALYGRIDRPLLKSKLGRKSKFQLNRHPIKFYQPVKPFGSMLCPELHFPLAHNWYDSFDADECKVEITNSRTGQLYYQKSGISRLSKLSLLERYHDLLDLKYPPLNGSKYSAKIRYYKELKDNSVDYQNAKAALFETFEELRLGMWKGVCDADWFKI